jgi:hypothetical protein
MTCHFCNETYRLNEAALEDILAARREQQTVSGEQ